MYISLRFIKFFVVHHMKYQHVCLLPPLFLLKSKRISFNYQQNSTVAIIYRYAMIYLYYTMESFLYIYWLVVSTPLKNIS